MFSNSNNKDGMFALPADDDMFDPAEMSDEAPEHIQKNRGHNDTQSPKKQVQFDEADLKQNQKKAKTANNFHLKKSAGIDEENPMHLIEAEINALLKAGQLDARDRALIAYCQLANDTAQNSDPEDAGEQTRVMKMLQQCIRVIEQHSSKTSPRSELFYETFNN